MASIIMAESLGPVKYILLWIIMNICTYQVKCIDIGMDMLRTYSYNIYFCMK